MHAKQTTTRRIFFQYFFSCLVAIDFLSLLFACHYFSPTKKINVKVISYFVQNCWMLFFTKIASHFVQLLNTVLLLFVYAKFLSSVQRWMRHFVFGGGGGGGVCVVIPARWGATKLISHYCLCICKYPTHFLFNPSFRHIFWTTLSTLNAVSVRFPTENVKCYIKRTVPWIS